MSPSKQDSAAKRLVLISNRLPISLAKSNGRWQISSSSGGLVTAMGPVLRNRGGLWIGWPGTENSSGMEKALEGEQDKLGFGLLAVNLTMEEQEKFYFGFSNEIIWPLFHSLQSLCNYDPEYWKTYESVNAKFANKIMEHSTPNDYLWVHDYHLMYVGKKLKELGVQTPIGFFLHIPFPSMDIFQKLPWRMEVLAGLLEFDLIGFQTQRHKRNFLQCIRSMMKNVQIIGQGPLSVIKMGKREIVVGNFPIGIDAKAFSINSSSPEVEHQAIKLNNAFPGCQKLLGVDRLDYTKGIPYKLDGFRRALQLYPELRRKVTLIQVLVPSREDIPEYHDLKMEIERLVGEINGQFSEPDWIPIHYMFRHLKRDELLAYYRGCEIGLVTPLDDGMNLVAKEYCASSEAEDSVLILSEFAGAAAQLRVGSITVNPYDQDGMAAAIYQATAMSREERRFRMRRLQKVVREQDIFGWVDSFLQVGNASELGDYPTILQNQQDGVDDSWWWESV